MKVEEASPVAMTQPTEAASTDIKEPAPTPGIRPGEASRQGKRPRWWHNAETRLNLLVAGLLMLLALLFVAPGLPPWGVPAPMDQILSYVPWTGYYPEANPIFRGGDQLRQQLPWRYWAQHEWEARAWVQNATWEQVRSYAAFVEAPADAVAAIQPDPAGTSPGSTEVLEYRPGQIRIRVTASRPSLLVVAESFYPGWSARLDGADVHILRTNYMSQGVVVPEGSHEVVFSYRSPALLNGTIIAVVGLAGLLALVLWAWRPAWLPRLRQRDRSREVAVQAL